jgi:gliding motility-associated-like protein
LELEDGKGCIADTTDAVNNTLEASVYVRELPTVSMPNTAVCKDDNVWITFIGKPPFTLDYKVNGQQPGYYHLPTVFKELSDSTFDSTDYNEVSLNQFGNVYYAEVKAGEAGNFEFILLGVTDAYNCTNYKPDTVNIEILHLPDASITEKTVCANNYIRIDFTGTPPFKNIEVSFEILGGAYHKYTLKHGVDSVNDTYILVPLDSVTDNSVTIGEGQYKCIISLEDGNGCVNPIIEIDTITVLPRPTVSMSDNPVCAGDNVQIDFEGTPPFTLYYSVNNANPANIGLPYPLYATQDTAITAGSAGTFAFVLDSLIDANGCVNKLDQTLSLTVKAHPTVKMLDLDNDTICLGESKTLVFTGVKPYDIEFRSNGQTYHRTNINVDTLAITSAHTGLFGFKLVNLTDASGCSYDAANSTDTATIFVNKLPTVSMPNTAVCKDDNVTITFTGRPPFTLDYTVNGQLPSVYTLPTIFGGSGYSITQAGSSDTFTASIPAGEAGDFIFNLISVSDYNGCVDTTGQTVNITVKAHPTVKMLDLDNDTICLGESKTLVFTGVKPYDIEFRSNGVTYYRTNINADTLAITSVQTGLFGFKLVNLTDASGCSYDAANSTDTATIFVKALPKVTVALVNDLCVGEGISLHFDGQPPYVLEYSIDGFSNPSDIGLPASPLTVYNDTTIVAGSEGTFMFRFVSLTDDNNCTGTSNVDSLEVTVNPLSTVTVSVPAGDLCVGDGIDLEFTGTPPYTLEYTVNGYHPSTVGLVSPLTVYGNDTTIIAGAPSGILKFKFNFISLTDSNHCSGTPNVNEFEVRVHALPEVSIVGVNSPVCATHTNQFAGVPAGGTWKSLDASVATVTNGLVTGVSAGTATIRYIYTNTNNCTDSAEVIVTVNPVPSKPEISVDSVCFGETLTFTTVSNLAEYEWTNTNSGIVEINTSNTITQTNSGIYSYVVRVKNTEGCWSEYSDTATGIIYTLPATPSITVNDVCFGETLTFETTQSYVEYEWVSGNDTVVNTSNVITQTAEGTYTYKVRVKDAHGCWSAYSAEVSGEVYALPLTPSITVTNVCFGGTLTFTTASGHTEYEWKETNSGAVVTNTSNTITQTNSGIYYYIVRVKNAEGCWSAYSDTVRGEVYPDLVKPVIEPSGTTAICTGDALTLTATTGFANYTWYHNGTQTGNGPENTLSVDKAGNYTVQVTTTYGCGSGTSEKVTVEVIPYPTKPVITADGLSNGEVWRRTGMGIVFEVSNKIDTLIYQWYHNGSVISGGQGEALSLTALRLTDAGIYTVTARTQKAGCSTESDNAELKMREDVYVPRLVTPNNDNENDDLNIKGLEIYPHNELIIINRWGNEVFRSRDYVNGTWKGDNLPDGTYFYKLRLRESNGYVEEITGFFHLKR